MTNDNNKKSNKGWWILTAVSAVILLLITIFIPEAFWLGLPTFFTGLVKGMDWV